VVASRTQSQGVVVEILIDHKIGMNHNLESIRIDSTDSDSISVQIANRITMGESIRKATQLGASRFALRVRLPAPKLLARHSTGLGQSAHEMHTKVKGQDTFGLVARVISWCFERT
jgi:hypothetical protein